MGGGVRGRRRESGGGQAVVHRASLPIGAGLPRLHRTRGTPFCRKTSRREESADGSM